MTVVNQQEKFIPTWSKRSAASIDEFVWSAGSNQGSPNEIPTLPDMH